MLNREEIEGAVCLVLGGKPETGNGQEFHTGGPSTEPGSGHTTVRAKIRP